MLKKNRKRSKVLNFLLWLGIGVISVFSFSGEAYCQVSIECVKKDSRGRWKPVKNSECTQYTKAEFKAVVDRLEQLRYYKKKYQPACELTKKEYKKIDTNWKREEVRWGRQVIHYRTLIEYNQREAKTWRDSFFTLKKLKVPKKSWTESPKLWFAVGMVVAVAVVVGTATMLNAIRPVVTTKASALRWSPVNSRQYRVFQKIKKPTILRFDTVIYRSK